MPKRVIDFDAMWGSDKLAACAEWAQSEYAWLYGLADPSGCFELTNLRVIWGRVAAIRRNLTIERLEEIFNEFQDKGLLFVWEENGKRYAHWSGSDVPGRLPPPSWRMRLERLAPPLPKQQFAEFMSKFARGRATFPGGAFVAEASKEIVNAKADKKVVGRVDCAVDPNPPDEQSISAVNRTSPQENATATDPWTALKQRLEAPQAQDWGSDRNRKKKEEGNRCVRDTHTGEVGSINPQTAFFNKKVSSESAKPLTNRAEVEATRPPSGGQVGGASSAQSKSALPEQLEGASPEQVESALPAQRQNALSAPPMQYRYAAAEKSSTVAREIAVGRGPGTDRPEGFVRLNPVALERIRLREAARNEKRREGSSGGRGP